MTRICLPLFAAVLSTPALAQDVSVLDLGNLNGSNSLVSAVNDAGQVAGRSGYDAFFWDSSTGIVDIGDLGGNQTTVFNMNTSGQVVGQSRTTVGCGIGKGKCFNAYVWDAQTGMTALGTLGGLESEAIYISDSGFVAGSSQTTAGPRHAFRWTASGGMEDLGTLGGSASGVTAVSEDGAVAGLAHDATNQFRAAYWAPDGTLVDLGIPAGGTNARATDMNDAHQVIGWSKDPQGVMKAFYWDPSLPSPIELGLGDASVAMGINASGLVAGHGKRPGSTVDEAWIYDPATDTLTELGTLGSTTRSTRVQDIGDDGTIVGFSHCPGATWGTAFAWRPDVGMTALGTMGTGVLSRAQGVLSDGRVWGSSATRSRYDEHPFVWDPATGWLVDIDLNRAEARLMSDGGYLAGDFYNTNGENNVFRAELVGTDPPGGLSRYRPLGTQCGENPDPPPPCTDTDGDSVCDPDDPCPTDPTNADADGDDVCDVDDACPADPDNDQDADGVCGDIDLCPQHYDPQQEDLDGDSIGDACDTDADGDGFGDDTDQCLTDVPSQTDLRLDGCPSTRCDLSSYIEGLDPDEAHPKWRRSLIAKAENACRLAEQAKLTPADNLLEALLNEADAQRDAKVTGAVVDVLHDAVDTLAW